MRTFTETKRIVLLAVLTALGAILMLVEIPYPPVPWLMFDISDLPILLMLQSLGFGAAFIGAVAKSFINFLMKGMAGPLAIGQVTAVISSLSLALIYVGFRNRLKWGRAISLGATAVLYSAFLTFCNWLFITPIYFGGLWFRDVMSWLNFDSFLEGSRFHFGYTASIIVVYFPFNVLKSAIILGIYELIQPRLLPPLYRLLSRKD